jgi:DNA-binding transcriptional ArsR family regulator
MAEESPEPGRGAGSETGARPRDVDCGQGELHRRRPGADQVQRGTGTAYRDWTSAGGTPARERHARTAWRPPVAARDAAHVPGHRTTATGAVRTYPPWPGFADSPASSLEEGLEFVRSTPRSAWRADLADGYLDRAGRPPCWVRNLADGDTEAIDIVMRALRDFYAAVVAPRWESVVSSFHGDVARRMPVLAAGGYQALFGTLHRQLRWQDNGLERQGVDFEHDLGGTGMLMMPSAFWTGPPVFVLDGERIPNVLVYAAQPNGRADGPDHASLSGEAGHDSLAILIGSTRAAVLRALAEPCGTADLAATTGISAASASEHAKALRDADLVQTRREGRSVRHSLTPLGRTMLGQLQSAAT